MINQVLTVDEIEDSAYGLYGVQGLDGRYVKSYRIKTKEGFSFSATPEQVQGMAIGQKIRYIVAPLDAKTSSELDDAYEVIADLVAKGKAAAENYAKAAKGNKALLATQAITLAALVWEFVK